MKSNGNGKKTIFLVAYSGLFAALIAVITFFPKIPIPGSSGGYVHMGDAFVYMCASFLPLPFAPIAAGVGGLLADVISGAAHYAPFTFVIKALMTLPFTSKSQKIICKRNSIALVAGMLINGLGYFVAEWIMYSFAAAVVTIPWSIIQSVVGTVVYLAASAIFDKTGVKKKLMKY